MKAEILCRHVACMSQVRAPWKNAGVHSLVSAPYELRSAIPPHLPPHTHHHHRQAYDVTKPPLHIWDAPPCCYSA